MLYFFNNRDTKCQEEFHKQLKGSCDALQRDHFDACCHILNIFLIKEFEGRVSCTVADIIKKACAAFNAYALGSDIVSHLCELAESLSEQNKIMFLPNSANPEKSLIIFDADALISNVGRQLLTSQQFSNMELSHMTDVSEIPWSSIQHHLPDLDLDPSSVASYLKSLGYRSTSHGTLQLSYSDDATSLNSDIGCSTLAISRWPSTDSGMSSASCLTTSSGASIEQDLRLFPLHSRNSSESDVLCEQSLSNGESTHCDSKHNKEVIKESCNTDVYYGTESCPTTLNKLSKDSDNKCFMSENCHTQDSDTKGNIMLGKHGKVNINIYVYISTINFTLSGCHFCHNSRHMVKQYLLCSQNIASVPFQDHVTVIEFDASGGEYKNIDHDITLSIPTGAVPQGEILHMEVAAALYGPFDFSNGKRPISPILWLCPQENVVLLKPVSIVLPHILVNLTQEDITKFRIQVAKTDHRDYVTTTEGKRKYVFRPCSAAMELKLSQERDYVAIKTDHFCFMCLEMNKLENTSPEVAHQMAMKMGYYLHCVESLQPPYLVSPPREIIHFCVSFFLETCRKVAIKNANI